MTFACFVTQIYSAKLAGLGTRTLLAELGQACRSMAREDKAGRDWSRANGYLGYTSYASLDDLAWRAPPFADLQRRLDEHAAAFAAELDLDLAGRPLRLDSLWINILAPNGTHSGHIHPHSVLSGTVYVEVPDGAGAIRFEDPRLTMMMAAPPRRARAAPELQPFRVLKPKAGAVLMWESWLRHEVLVNTARMPRISVSFNYRWG
jgi:uncharacterized protein (TIGR02466 family)